MTLRRIVLYFLRLGATGFGGPIALAGAMHQALVVERRWIEEEDFRDGLALAQLAPGPLAAQLAIYIGYVAGGFAGATLVAVAFVLPSFFIVWAISLLYVRYGGLPWMQAVFYGVGACVIAIIVRSTIRLVKSTLMSSDPSSPSRLQLWVIFSALAATTVWYEREIASLVILGGVVAWGSAVAARRPASHAAAVSPHLLLVLFAFFTQAGALVFGSGLAIVPFLYGGVVQEYRWLSEQQFLDSVAVAMITPGPVVISVAFIGYLVASEPGMVVASIGVFLPVYLFVVIPAPYFRRIRDNIHVKAFVAGVTAAATGAIAGAAVVLARRAIVDAWTVAIAVITLVVLLRWKVSELWLIGGAAAAGLALRSAL